MPERDLDPKVKTFLEKLALLDTGSKAKLKRDAGKTIGESHSIGLFYRLLPYGLNAAQEESYFLVATLYPMVENGAVGNLGASLRRARDPKNNKGLDRRIEILLDSDKTQLPFRLRQVIKFLKSKRVSVNCQQLLNDLQKWNQPNRIVQKQWARDYFALPAKMPANEPITVLSEAYDD